MQRRPIPVPSGPHRAQTRRPRRAQTGAGRSARHDLTMTAIKVIGEFAKWALVVNPTFNTLPALQPQTTCAPALPVGWQRTVHSPVDRVRLVFVAWRSTGRISHLWPPEAAPRGWPCPPSPPALPLPLPPP